MAELTRDELLKVFKISDKVVRTFDDLGVHFSKLTVSMDFENVIRNNTKLDLDLLLDDKHNDTLVHDYIGIYNNLNRTNGKLENEFLPRSAIEG